MAEPNDPPDAIAAQYNRWVYPEPVADLVEHSRTKRQLTDPSLSHLLYWPDRDYPSGLKILVAGCGANQAAEIAFHNPTAAVVASTSARLRWRTSARSSRSTGSAISRCGCCRRRRRHARPGIRSDHLDRRAASPDRSPRRPARAARAAWRPTG
ncbi:MAG: hypothetical protein WDO24_23020 [Pseudomonadota bacterium]